MSIMEPTDEDILSDLIDSDEQEADGDPKLEDVDLAQVAMLQNLIHIGNDLPQEDRNMLNLGLLHQMYGDDLEIL